MLSYSDTADKPLTAKEVEDILNYFENGCQDEYVPTVLGIPTSALSQEVDNAAKDR